MACGEARMDISAPEGGIGEEDNVFVHLYPVKDAAGKAKTDYQRHLEI